VDTDFLQEYLADLPLGQVIFYPVLGSTNTEGMQRAEEGAPHLSLVAADEQTAGRGRLDRAWYSPPGAALAFSLLIRPEHNRAISTARLTGLGALAVCDILQSGYRLPAKIKWPNDVLVSGSKLAGVLVEAQWQGDDIQCAVLGIGINVAQKSVPSQGDLDFPATSVESVFGVPIDRWLLLKQVLEAVLTRLPLLDQDGFIEDWQGNLAYRGKLVQILRDGAEPEIGRIQGLNHAGYLRLRSPSGEEKLIQSGDVKLRQVDRT
jgi:BirA family biotin operon repressor/biotin-[acetyl-CoA-carboxylase] ligase